MISDSFLPLVGVSSRIISQCPQQYTSAIKTTNSIDHALALWLASLNLLPVLIPAITSKNCTSKIKAKAYAEQCHALLLQGGADVTPIRYGEVSLRPEWSGDALGDEYELELIHAFMQQEKPIFGICRGMQLLNVYFGGSLYQDLSTQLNTAITHGTPNSEHQTHTVTIVSDSLFDTLFEESSGHVMSSHHQAINKLGRGFSIQAHSEDGVIEAIAHMGHQCVAGVQWHPEYHTNYPHLPMLSSEQLMAPFIQAIITR